MGSGASLLSYTELFGNITNNKQIADIIPRIIRNKNVPSIPEILFSNIDLVVVILSLFITLRILIPNTMIYNGGVFWTMIILLLITPLISAIVFYSIRQTYSDGKGEEGYIFPLSGFIIGLLPILFLVFISWPMTSMLGIEVGGLYVILWLFVMLPLLIGLTYVVKTIAPIFVLMLGPGVIPYLANNSFFEFCS